ncbi:hypothetical protein D522_00696 [Mycobacterium avium subsp. paratuberculosis S5]|nr:hypothetical protein D522_00696 [Mycobacterium avium subsp. paratuberculosis S5]
MDGVDDTDEVDVKGIDEALDGNVVAKRADSGISHNDVQAAELSDRFIEERLQTDPVADIHLCGDNAATGLLDELRGVVQVSPCGQCVLIAGNVLADVHDDEVGAFIGQVHRMAAALAATSTCHERNLAGQSAHGSSLSS